MSESSENPTPPPAGAAGAFEERRVYASAMKWGTRVSFAVLVLAYATYLLGLLPARVPPRELPAYWSLSAKDYARATGAPAGWGWVGDLGRGDSLMILPVALLAGLSVLGYGRILPVLLRKGDTFQALIAAAEILVILAAASGWIRAGGH